MTTLQPARPTEMADVLVVDADTHLSEPWDLWTSRAPAGYADRLPHVDTSGESPVWVLEDVEIGPAFAVSVIDKNNAKVLGTEFLFNSTVAEVSPAASQVDPRLAVMDETGIWAQIVYPNAVGFGAQQVGLVPDQTVRSLTVRIYNDAMAEMQAESGNRLFPQAVLPWWDLDETLVELARIKELGLTGVNITADPQADGHPDLGTAHWDPLWHTLVDLELPLNFHIGASATQKNYSGTAPWPSQDADRRLSIGSSMLFVSNARVISNMIFAGVFERHPELHMVSVESGVGWLPFYLQALDHQVREVSGTPSGLGLSMMPSEYFRRNCWACFWFEADLLVPTIEWLGVENCLFETDFPHPTCLYPDPVSTAAAALREVDDDFRRKVFGGNAMDLYHLPAPPQ